MFVDADAEIGERDAGPDRVAEIRRRVDPLRPVGLRRHEAFRRAIVEQSDAERSGLHARVERRDRRGQCRRVRARAAAPAPRCCRRLNGAEHRRDERARNLRVEDRVRRAAPAAPRSGSPRSRSASATGPRPRRRIAAPSRSPQSRTGSHRPASRSRRRSAGARASTAMQCSPRGSPVRLAPTA